MGGWFRDVHVALQLGKAEARAEAVLGDEFDFRWRRGVRKTNQQRIFGATVMEAALQPASWFNCYRRRSAEETGYASSSSLRVLPIESRQAVSPFAPPP